MKNKMQGINFLAILWVACLLTPVSAQHNKSLVNTSQSPYTRLTSVGLGDVKWTQGFWAERFTVCKNTMSPELLKTYMNEHISHSFENFRVAAGLSEGAHSGPVFHDGDMYKTIEAQASLYAVTKDEDVNNQLDEIIAVIAKAQRADGYLHTPVQIAEQRQMKNDAERLNFESYNLGHLMMAACVHFRATEKRNLLDIAIKATDFLCRYYKNATPAEARNAVCPSHYMGLVEMFRTTRDPKYLELSKRLIDIRGLMENGTDDNQDRIPFRQQTKAMGHAVRANYLYAGVADVYAETGDTSLLRPLKLIWENMTHTKMYITGACGALYDGVSPDGTSYNPPEVQKIHQAYGRDFQLPNKTAHNETCANIGNLLWNWRMFLLTGEAKYMDIVELTLYNSILSGVSLDGHDFCYTNPLSVSEQFPYELRWSGGRKPYIALSNCCPPNTVRTMAEVQNYAYSLSEDGVWVNLYGGNELNTTTKGGEEIQIVQTSDYPWNEEITLTVKKLPKKNSAVYLRIPDGCKNAFVAVNGQPETQTIRPGSYVKLNRTWKAGDKINLTLPMKTRLMEANPLVEETKNQVAVKRGPIVYCLEGIDLPEENIFNTTLSADIQLVKKEMNINNAHFIALEGIARIGGHTNWENTLYQEIKPADKPVKIRLIPYYAWGNRGQSDMTVWMNVTR